MRTTLIFISIAVISILATHLFYILTKERKFIKYIPAIFLIVLSAYNIIIARVAPSDGFRDLARIVAALFMLIASVSSILYGLFLDLLIK